MKIIKTDNYNKNASHNFNKNNFSDISLPATLPESTTTLPKTAIYPKTLYYLYIALRFCFYALPSLYIATYRLYRHISLIPLYIPAPKNTALS